MNPRLIISFLLILLVCSYSSYAIENYWKRDYTKPDSIAATTKIILDIEKLSTQLTSKLPDTIDKFRSIFSWIAFNIEYDCKAYRSPQKIKSNPNDVLNNRKSVCEGYANLFKALCSSSGLKSEIISGCSKNEAQDIGKFFPKDGTNHSWNAISVDGIWYLCDVTWAAGYVDGSCKNFFKEFKPYFFCTPVSVFNYQHYPVDKKWFLSNPLSKKTFINSPDYMRYSLSHNIKVISPSKGIIKFKEKKKIHFKISSDTLINSVSISLSNEKYTSSVDFNQEKSIVSFDYIFIKQAPYLTLYLNGNPAITFKLEL